MIHRAAPDFWNSYGALPASIQALADRAFALLKADPYHPSLHFKKADSLWSVRVGLHYRALGVGITVFSGSGLELMPITIAWWGSAQAVKVRDPVATPDGSKSPMSRKSEPIGRLIPRKISVERRGVGR